MKEYRDDQDLLQDFIGDMLTDLPDPEEATEFCRWFIHEYADETSDQYQRLIKEDPSQRTIEMMINEAVINLPEIDPIIEG